MGKSAKLKEEVATLEAELAGLAKSQAEMDKLRAEGKAAFEESSAELEKGLSGIKAALKVLNEYYAKEDKSHDAADGAGSGIISLLEVCEADFSKKLAQVRRRIEVGSFWRPGRTRCCFGVLGEDQEEVHCRGRDVRRSRGPQGGRDHWPQASLGHLGERDCACAVFPQAQEFPRRLASVSPALLSLRETNGGYTKRCSQGSYGADRNMLVVDV